MSDASGDDDFRELIDEVLADKTFEPPWAAIMAARAEAATAVAAFLDLTGPIGFRWIEEDAAAYIETRLAMLPEEPE